MAVVIASHGHWSPTRAGKACFLCGDSMGNFPFVMWLGADGQVILLHTQRVGLHNSISNCAEILCKMLGQDSTKAQKIQRQQDEEAAR